MIVGQIEGVQALHDNLELMRTDIGLRAARLAGRRAADVIKQAAIANAQTLDDSETENAIWKNIVVQARTRAFKATGDITFAVGVRGGAKSRKDNEKNPGGDTFYWRFVELGTSKVAAKPFMLPALRDNIGKATNVFVREFTKELDKSMKKLKRGSK